MYSNKKSKVIIKMAEVCMDSRDPSLLEGLPNETLEANLQSSL
jgi:hypothetical protein